MNEGVIAFSKKVHVFGVFCFLFFLDTLYLGLLRQSSLLRTTSFRGQALTRNATENEALNGLPIFSLYILLRSPTDSLFFNRFWQDPTRKMSFMGQNNKQKFYGRHTALNSSCCEASSNRQISRNTRKNWTWLDPVYS